MPEDITIPRVRMLNAQIGTTSEFVDVDGGLMIKNVLLIDEGTWTDSLVGTPLFYPSKTLEKNTEIISNSVFSRHGGGSPRDSTDLVGRAKNIRFMNTGLWGDVYMHNRTQKSKDMSELIKAGEINSISIEHYWNESYNDSNKQMEATWVGLDGMAWVEHGACTSCGVRTGRFALKNNSQSCAPLPELDTKPIKEQESDEMDEELKKFMSDFETRLKAIEGSLSDAKAKSEKDLSEMRTDLTKELGEAKMKIKLLEETGKPLGVSDSPNPNTYRVKTEATYSMREI